MVIAHHLVWTAYGWWLPNDPRGSRSQVIRRDVLKELGELHFGRKRVQVASFELHEFYERASELLRHALLTFDPEEVGAIADAIAGVIRAQSYTCYACAIMPDHVHVVIRKHLHRAEEMIRNLQVASCESVRAVGLRDEHHPVWAQGGWKVFLDSPQDIWRTIGYVQDNPVKGGLSRQEWEFVRRYDNWPFHRRLGWGSR